MSSAPTTTKRELPGYTIRERIGAGGYGEVWTAEAPGGLEKAVKFVYGYLDEARASRELKALNRIKTVRHPFLLSLERIEIVEGQLVIVTELADGSLKDRFEECQGESLRGIPREELLGYLSDSAEALDYMNAKHGLQHLDVKPENMLLSAGRVKVADFGLVKDLQDVNMSMMGGLTPAYAAPEVFSSQPSARSDQYSLAILFQELLTGTLPFPGRSAAQLASQHMSARPNVSSLPEADRPVILRALSKDPKARFDTCMELVEALANEPFVEEDKSDDLPAPTDKASESPRRHVPTQHITKSRRSSSATSIPVPTKEYGSALHNRVAEQLMKELNQPLTAESLPPHDTSTSERLRPHLIISIGGSAAMTTKAFLADMKRQHGDLDQLPAIQHLLLDADPAMPRMLERAGYQAPAHDRVMISRLKNVQQYRSGSQKYLKWLSRRWLYNIPNSQTPESMRPLGRLAFVDHETEVRARIGQLIEQAIDPESIAATAKAFATEFDQALRIVVVASASGGVGGGALLDVGNWIREELTERNMNAEVRALLLHGTGRQSEQADLGVANTFATLAEVHDRLRRDWAGESSKSLPFDQVNLHLLGEHLAPEEWKDKTRNAARYLSLLLTQAGARYEKARKSKESHDEIPPVTISSFHATVIGKSTDGLTGGLLDAVRGDVIDRWRLGALAGKKAKQAEPYQGCVDAVTQLADGLNLTSEALVAEIEGMIEKAARGPLTTRIVETWTEILELNALPEISDRQVAQARRIAQEFLGIDIEGSREYTQIDPLDELSVPLVSRFLQSRASAVRELISHLAEEASAGMAGALHADGMFRHRLSELEKLLSSRHDEQVREGEQLIEKMNAVAKMTPAEKSKVKPPERDVLLIQFFRSLSQRLVLRKSLQVVRFLDDVLADLQRNLSSLDRELAALSPEKVAALGLDDDDQEPDEGKQTSLLRQAAEQLLEQEHGNVAARIDADLRAQFLCELGGFSKIVLEGKTLQDMLDGPLRTAVKRHVEAAVQDIRLTEIVTVQQKIADAQSPDQSESAELLQCGGKARWLLMLPEGSPESTLPKQVADKINTTPAVDYHSAGEVTLFCLADEIPLSRIGAHLIGHAGHFAEVAERLHTRTDIDWLPLFAQ